VLGQLHESELSFSKGLVKFIKIEKVRISNALLKEIHPFALLLLTFEIQNPALIGRDNNLYGPVGISAIDFLRQLFNEGSYQAVHHSMDSVIFVPVAVKFISHNHAPVLLELVCFSFEQAGPFIKLVVVVHCVEVVNCLL
jgi:hypothetical protein